MGGTREGGLKAAAKLKAQDPDYFKKLRQRVKQPTGGKHAANGFDKDPDRARSAGAAGGRVSRRRKSEHSQEAAQLHHTEGQAQGEPNGRDDRRSDGGTRQDDQPTARGGEA